MNIAVLHYHLKRGGVTRVIANHLHALHAHANEQSAGRIELAIFHGGNTSGWPAELPTDSKHVQFTLHELPALQYDRPLEDADAIVSQLTAELQKLGWNRENTLLHVHNHSLGKSLALPQAVLNLARSGWRTLLQIHDFAEDFRPANYRSMSQVVGDDLNALLYPAGAHIHYAVLNGRDFSALQTAGVGAENLHSLPNPVTPFSNLPDAQEARKLANETFGVPAQATLAVYPVRGIARKNIGETLLYTALGAGSLWAGVTLSPTNPEEIAAYNHWKDFASSLELPFLFGMGDAGGLNFQQNLAAADKFITTSVAEGFGMVFLEANFADRPLIGRDLPEITADFVDVGMRFPALRKQLLVPLEWVGEVAFTEMISQVYQNARQAYGLPAEPTASLQTKCASMIDDGVVDFACLSADLQREVIAKVAADSACQTAIFDLNKGLHDAIFGDAAQNAPDLEHNRTVVSEHYSSAAIGKRLAGLYETVSKSPCSAVTQVSNAGALLDFFLDIRRMNPVRL